MARFVALLAAGMAAAATAAPLDLRAAEATQPTFDAGADYPNVIKEMSKTYQLGKFPFIGSASAAAGGGKPFVAATSLADCEKRCLDEPDCLYGTYVTHDTTHGASVATAAGECWLALATHDNLVACGVPCTSFKKVPRAAAASPTPLTEYGSDGLLLHDGLGTIVCSQDAKTCWDGSTVVRNSRKGCRFDACPPRPACRCDPAKHPSEYTQCHQDPWSLHIVVTHLEPRFHHRPLPRDAQHRCQVTTGGGTTRCLCCECFPNPVGDSAFAHGFHDLGFGAHLVAKAAAGSAASANSLVREYEAASYAKCVELCGNTPGCKFGSYIERATGSCMLAFAEPEVDADGKYKTQRCAVGQKTCHTFTVEGRGFAPAAAAVAAAAANTHTRLRYQKCTWDADNSRCEPSVPRSPHYSAGVSPADVRRRLAATATATPFRPGFARHAVSHEPAAPGVARPHPSANPLAAETIPNFTEQECNAAAQSYHHVKWLGGRCQYGCHVIVDAVACRGAEDIFAVRGAATTTTTAAPAATTAAAPLLNGCPLNHVGSGTTGCTACGAGQGVLYSGCTPNMPGAPGTPVPYQVCRPCGGKTVYPCAAPAAPCQARFTAPSTGPAGHRLHLRPAGAAGGCTRGLCHVCGYQGGSYCNGSEQGSDGPCDAGLYPSKWGTHTCTNTGKPLPSVGGVYYHPVGTSNTPDMNNPLIAVSTSTV